MALPTTLNRSRSSLVFLKAETTSGTIAAHPASADRFDLTTPPVIGQAGNYTDTSEIGPELITTDRILNYMDYSSFDFEFYAKPPGGVTDTALGTPSDFAGASGADTFIITGTGSVAVGDTIVISGNTDTDAAKINGVHKVTAIGGGTYTVTLSTNLTAAADTHAGMSVSKRVLNTNASSVVGPEEHAIMSRAFGAVKFLSSGQHNGYIQGSNTATGVVTQAQAAMIQYYLQNTVQTLTVSSRQFTDDAVQMYTATGALPTSFSLSLAKEGPVTYSVGFQANRVYYSGTLELSVASNNSVAHNAATSVKVISPKRHASNTLANAADVAWLSGSIGSKFTLKNNGSLVTSSGGDTTVFEVKAAPLETLTGTTDLLSIEPVTNAPSGTTTLSTSAFLIPFAPDPACAVASIVGQRKVQGFITDALTGSGLSHSTSANTELFHADNELDVTAFSVDFDRSITTPGLTEMTGEEYPPASYVINEPTITGSITLLLRPKDFQYMNSLRAEPKRAIGVRIGDTVGSIIEIAAPAVFMEIPTPADLDGATSIDIPFTVVKGTECDDADKFFVRYR